VFAIASLLLILVACAHSAGGFAPPQSEAEATLLRSMQQFTMDGGMHMRFSMQDVLRSVWHTMSLLLVFWAVQNLCGAALAPAHLYRAFTRLSLVMSAGITAFLLR
jgi:hypothetical protein